MVYAKFVPFFNLCCFQIFALQKYHLLRMKMPLGQLCLKVYWSQKSV